MTGSAIESTPTTEHLAVKTQETRLWWTSYLHTLAFGSFFELWMPALTLRPVNNEPSAGNRRGHFSLICCCLMLFVPQKWTWPHNPAVCWDAANGDSGPLPRSLMAGVVVFHSQARSFIAVPLQPRHLVCYPIPMLDHLVISLQFFYINYMYIGL